MTILAAYQIIDLSKYREMDEISAELNFDCIFDPLHGGGKRAQHEYHYRFRLTPDTLTNIEQDHIQTLEYLKGDPEATALNNEKHELRVQMVSEALTDAGNIEQPGLIYHLIRIMDPSVGDVLRQKLPALGYTLLEDRL